MFARTWPGLLLVLLLNLLLMPPFVLIVGFCAWVEDMAEVVAYFRAVRGEFRKEIELPRKANDSGV